MTQYTVEIKRGDCDLGPDDCAACIQGNIARDALTRLGAPVDNPE